MVYNTQCRAPAVGCSNWGATAVVATMAKKRPGSKADGPKGEQRVRTAVTTIRSMPEWKEWLGRFADAQRKDVSDLVDESLMRMARAEGFELPPKR